MKVSEITNLLLANYLRLSYTDLSDAEKTELTTLVSVAKAYIKSYTGLCDERGIDGEEIGTGDGSTTEFTTMYSPIVSGTLILYAGGEKITSGYDTDYATGAIAFETAPASGVTITADYDAGIDAYEEFVIAVYVLCTDMYENRAMYVDKSNANKVVENILGMHCRNLL